MPSQDNIEILYGGTWEKDQQRFAKSVDSMVSDIDRLTKAAKGIKIDFGGADAGAFKKMQVDAAAIINTLKDRIRELEKATKDNTKAQIDAEKVAQQQIKTKREQTRLEIVLQKEIERKQKLLDAESKKLEQNKGAYAALSKEYNTAARNAQDLGAELIRLEKEFGKNPTTVEKVRLEALRNSYLAASKGAATMHKELLSIDMSVGRSQRNVGNYNSSITQFGYILQELPNAGISFRTFIMSISNNVGDLARTFVQARKEGQSWGSILKDLGKQLISTQGLIYLAVAAVTYFATQSSDAAKKTGDFAEALGSSGTQAAEAKFQLEAYKKAFEDTTTSMADKQAMLEEYNRKWGDQAGHLKNVGELELFLQNKAQAFIDTLFLRAKATAALSAATELLTENMKNQANKGVELVSTFDAVLAGVTNPYNRIGAISDLASKAQKELSKNTEETTKKVEALKNMYIQFSEEAADLAKANNFDLDGKKNKAGRKDKKPEDLTDKILADRKAAMEAISNYEIEAYERNAAAAKATSEDESAALEDRLLAYKYYQDERIAIIDELEQKEQKAMQAERDREIYDITQSTATEQQKAKAMAAIQEKFENEAFAMYAKYDTERTEIDIKGTEDRRKIAESDIKQQIAIIKQGADEIEARITDAENKKLIALQESYNAGNMSYRQYQQERKAITADADQQVFALQKKYFEGYIDDLEKQGKLTIEVARAIRKELNKEMPGGGAEKGRTIFGLGKDDIADTQEAFNYTMSAIDSIGDAKDAQREKEIAAHEATMERIKREEEAEILKIQALGLADKEEAERIAKVKAMSLAKQRQEEIAIISIKRRQASADKQANINEVVGKTAIAAMQAYIAAKNPILGAFYAATVLAAGAAQVSAIANRPLPQYAKGTKSKPMDGLAVVGEIGSEAYRLPTGQWGVTPSTPTVMDLPKGTEIFTAQQTSDMMKAGALKSLAASGKRVDEWEYMRAIIASSEAGSKRIEKAIQNQKPNVVNIYGLNGYTHHKQHH